MSLTVMFGFICDERTSFAIASRNKPSLTWAVRRKCSRWGTRTRNRAAGSNPKKPSSNSSVKSNGRQLGLIQGPKTLSLSGRHSMVTDDIVVEKGRIDGDDGGGDLDGPGLLAINTGWGKGQASPPPQSSNRVGHPYLSICFTPGTPG